MTRFGAQNKTEINIRHGMLYNRHHSYLYHHLECKSLSSVLRNMEKVVWWRCFNRAAVERPIEILEFLRIENSISHIPDWLIKRRIKFLKLSSIEKYLEAYGIFLQKNEPNFRSNFNFKLIPWPILPNWLILISGRCEWLETFFFTFFTGNNI